MKPPHSKLPFALLVASALLLTGCHPKDAAYHPPTPLTQNQAQKSEPKIAIRSMDRRVPVIMYHDVLAHPTEHPVYFDTSADELESQMKMIEARGFQPISLDQLYAHLTTGAEIPRKSVVLTFDDNYRGFYENAV